MITIKRLDDKFTAYDLERMNYLMSVLTNGYTLTDEELSSCVSNANVYVARNGDGVIVGTATLAVFHSPTGAKGSIEDVVVDPAYQGQGIGRMLVSHIIGVAKTYDAITLQLTSRPSRVAANYLYKSLGFELRETNFYKLKPRANEGNGTCSDCREQPRVREAKLPNEESK